MASVQDEIIDAVRRLAAAGVEDPWSNAVLFMEALLNREGVEQQLSRRLGTVESARYRGWISAREGRMPAQYILGFQTFRGLRISVTPDVFIPRSYTEALVRETLARLRNFSDERLLLAEIGSGSGAVSIAIAHAEERVSMIGIELRAEAVSLAAANAAHNGVEERVTFLVGSGPESLDDQVKGQLVALIANPPDLTPEETVDLVPEAHFEPIGALTAGSRDPLTVHRAILDAAPGLLRQDGFIAFHVRATRASELAEACEKFGFSSETVPSAKPTYPTVVIAGQRSPTS
ncbi:MAG: N5-glutamine methyltransferase family protein [Acidimicrobiia bacterium]